MINQKIEMTKFSTLEEWLDIQHQEYEEYVSESKQVGTLYHVTPISHFFQIIYKDRMEPQTNRFLLTSRDSRRHQPLIWFTRDKNYSYSFFRMHALHNKGAVTLKFNGDRLSYHYKIEPLRNQEWFDSKGYSYNDSNHDESAEVIFNRTITNVSRYLDAIYFDINNKQVGMEYIMNLLHLKKYFSPTELTNIRDYLIENFNMNEGISIYELKIDYIFDILWDTFKKFNDYTFAKEYINVLYDLNAILNLNINRRYIDLIRFF